MNHLRSSSTSEEKQRSGVDIGSNPFGWGKPMKHRHLFPRFVVVVLLTRSITAIAAAEQEVSFFEGSVTLYPKPEPVEVVQAASDIERDPITLAVANSGVTEQQYGNEGVAVRVLEARTAHQLDQIDAAPGNRFLLLSLEWKNISPRVMTKSGKPDRTMGAGSLFGGSASGGNNGKSHIEKDVAYKVPKWGDHLFVVADGVARSPHWAGANMSAGVGPSDSLMLGRFAEVKQQWIAFEIPAATRALALYFFDYSKGHIVLPLTGASPVLQPGKAVTENAVRRVSRGDLDLVVRPVRFAAEFGGTKAPREWKFAIVDFIGKSLSGSSARRDIFQIDIDKYAWLYGDGGYLYPAMQSSNESGDIRFTPEVYKWDQAVFLVPESGENFNLGLRFGSDVSVLPLGNTPPALAPNSFAQYEDEGMMTLHVFAKRRDNDKLIVDLGAEAMASGKGIELSPYRQFFVTALGNKIPVNKSATQLLAHGAGSAIVVPPDGLLRFSLVFDAPDDGVLDYRGLKSSGEISLAKTPQAGDEVTLAAMAKLDRRLAREPRKKTPERTPVKTAEPAGELSAQPGSAAGSGSDASRAARKLEPIALAPLLKEGATPEQEPNDKFEQAMELPAPFKVVGRTKTKEDDVFRFRVEGEPRLWTLGVRGTTVKELSLLDAAEHTLASQRKATGAESATINGLYLLPGWHWVRVRGGGTVEGEYVFQATPGDRPSPSSEREPNDDVSRAQRLRFGQLVNGIYAPGEQDYFRFSISAPALVRISVQPADGLTARILSLRSAGPAQASPSRNKPGETLKYDVQLEPGDYTFRVRLDGKAKDPQPYRLSVEHLSLFTKETGSDAVTDAGLSLVLDGTDQSVKAFWDEGQHIALALTLTNNSTEQRKIKLRSASSHFLWKPTATTESLTLNPAQTQRIPIMVDVGAQVPSNQKVRIGVRAETAAGGFNETGADFQPRCDVPPINPGPDHQLPGPMLGGLNLAWASLGGALPDVAEKNQKNPSRHMAIIDGYTPLTSSWHIYGEFPVDVPVRLAVTAPVLGITLNPTGCAGGGAVRQFEILSSADGLEFKSVLESTLSTLRKEQVFSFPAPVMSGFLKLRVRSTWRDDQKGRICLGELKALADPESDFSGGEGWNIADSKFGGHVVWSSFRAAGSTWSEVLTAKGSRGNFNADPDNANEWVVGFHHNRAAQVREIHWQRQEESRQPNELSRVDVAVSQDSPIGPWRSVGALSIDKTKEVSSLRFDDPVWARFVKFSSTDPDRAAKWQLPERLQILERTADAGYRSMLGEWGHYARNSAFEFLQERQPMSASSVKTVTGNGSKAKAHSLGSGQKVAGQVQRGKDEDWYRLSVPQGQNLLTIDLSGIPTLLVEPQLIDVGGRSVELKRDDKNAAHAYYSARVMPGNYLLQIREPIMSTVITWDNSGSVSPYVASIYQALEEFASGVVPQTELVNFLPFQQQEYDLLSKEWTDQPLLLAEALNNYDRSDASSDAEANLLAAVKHLRERQGNKMVLIVTDAASGKPDNRQLWQALSQVLPHVFTVELHGGDFAGQQDKMQDWADANGGIYTSFQTQPDLDMAFDRALCTMRRPAGYQLAIQSEFQKPRGPGTLRISVDSAAVAASSAVEIILDASGSMYQKIGDQTRIAVAKTVLTELLRTTIPAGTPVALRIYGHREARSCRTDLELPLRPLVAADALQIINSVDPQDRSRTPLADSLKLVAEDLVEATGPKLVILLTDGEESCDGDPEAAIRFLKEQGMNIKLNIVGMAIDSDIARQQFSEWAKIGGGLYFDADSPEALQAALEKSLFPKYQLINQNGDVAVEGTADGRSIDVAEGIYQLKVLTTPSRAMGEIRIEEGKNVEVVVGPE